MNVTALVSGLFLLAFFTGLGVWWIACSESVSDDFFGAQKPHEVRVFGVISIVVGLLVGIVFMNAAFHGTSE